VYISDDNQVKVVFNKYGSNLRNQLVKTIDSAEQYICKLQLDQNDSANAFLNQDDVDFFEDTIKKVRKLVAELKLELFPLVCQEIETCLIEINNKFFINESLMDH